MNLRISVAIIFLTVILSAYSKELGSFLALCFAITLYGFELFLESQKLKNSEMNTEKFNLLEEKLKKLEEKISIHVAFGMKK